jgi:LuxR family maltose regulon positive regulatory protein
VESFPLRTKLNIPSARADLVSRSRLDTVLNGALQPGVKLILVSAPAGSGKTSLLADWLSRCNLRTAWLSLDAEDNDPARFWEYVTRALTQAVPELAEDFMPLLINSQPFNPKIILTTLLGILGEWTAPEIRAPLLLSLDDFHLISNPEIQEGIGFWLEHAPTNLRLLISTRYDPPYKLARLRASGQLVEIRQDDLRFNAEEVQSFLLDKMKLDLSNEDIASLLERTEGWVTGLQLAALSLQSLTDRHGFIQALTGTHRHIADYLMEEVLHRIPSEIQDFLLVTSILERFDAHLCDWVMGRQDSQTMIAELERTNLFIVPLDSERCWYRYHHMFREHLQHRLRLAQRVRLNELHLRAATALAEAGLPSEAIGHALAAHQPQAALRIIEAEGDAQWNSGGLTTLIDWLEKLPKEVLLSSARACILFAWAIVLNGRLGRISEAEQYMAAAQTALLAQNTSPGEGAPLILWGMWHTTNAVLGSMMEDHPRAISGAHKALELLTPENPAWRGAAAVSLGHAYLIEGDVRAAIHAYRQAILANRQSGNLQMTIRSQIYLAIQLTYHGELYEAVRTCEEIIAGFSYHGRAVHPMLAGAYMVFAWVYLQWDRLDEAESMAEKACQLGRQWENAGMVYLGLMVLTHIYLGRQAYERALDFLDEAEQLARRNQTIQTYFIEIENARVWIWLAQGELDQVRDWLAGTVMDAELTYECEPRYVAIARAEIAIGTPAKALALLERLARADQAGERITNLIEIHILQALALAQTGETQASMEAFALALNYGARGGYRRVFLDIGAALVPLLQKAARQEVHGEYAQSLLTALGSSFTPDLTSAEITHRRAQTLTLKPLLEEPLTIREIEILKLIVAGKSNPQIAGELYLSINTVKVHIKNIYGKLGVESRTQAIARYRELGLE